MGIFKLISNIVFVEILTRSYCFDQRVSFTKNDIRIGHKEENYFRNGLFFAGNYFRFKNEPVSFVFFFAYVRNGEFSVTLG